MAPLIRAVQSHDVASCVKHFALNNQELNRMGVNVQVDERTLPRFTCGLPRGSCGRRRAGGDERLQSFPRRFLQPQRPSRPEILKGEWGFKGFVVTDSGSLHDTIQAPWPEPMWK